MEKVKLIASLILIAFVSCREQKSEAVTKVDSAFIGYAVPFDSAYYTVDEASYGRSKEVSKTPENKQVFYGDDDFGGKSFLSYEVIGRTKGSLNIDIGKYRVVGNLTEGSATIVTKGKVTITPTKDFDGIIYLTIKP